MSATNGRVVKSNLGKYLQDERPSPFQITVPTGNQQDKFIATNFIDVKIITRPASSRSDGRIEHTGKTPNARKNSSSPTPSVCSLESIDQNFRMIPNGPLRENGDLKPKFVRRRTAWDKSTSNKPESSASITSFVDFKDIKNSIGDATRPLDQEQKERGGVQSHHESHEISNVSIGQRPSTASGPMATTGGGQVPENSYESILRYYLAPRLIGTEHQHQSTTNRIKEVWGARSKNDVSARIQFTHEKLFRPKSASLPITNRLNYEKTSDMNEDNENVTDSFRSDRVTAKRLPTKKTKRRRPRSVTYRKSNHMLSSDANVSFTTKSLIRQSHRPTTSIIYSKPDVNAMPSITPCVRKARVSHKTSYACSHQRAADSASEGTESRGLSEYSKGNQSLNQAVKVSKLSQPSLEKGDTVLTRAMQEESTPSDVLSSSNNPSQLLQPKETPQPQQQEECFEEVAVSVDENEADSKQFETSDKPPHSDANTVNQIGISSKNPSVHNFDDANCPEKGDHSHLLQARKGLDQMQPRGVKIRPLFTQHVAKFNGPSNNVAMETGKKNRMIRQWLKTLTSSQESKHGSSV